jgi:hypothetical protein
VSYAPYDGPRSLAILPATALALTCWFVPAQAAGTPGWRTVATVSRPPLATFLLGVATAGPWHAWAVGFASASGGNTDLPVVQSWDGSVWSPVTLHSGVVSRLSRSGPPFLDTAPASAPGNVWAFTVPGGWLHYNGTAWKAGTLARGRALLQASLVTARGIVWVFGATASATGFAPYAAFESGTQAWKRTPVPAKGAIVAASAVSGGDIWAVLGTGILSFGRGPGGLVHWHGGRWHRVPGLPASLRNRSLGAVLARSDHNVWVGGAIRNSQQGTTEALGHWNGHRWTVVKLRAAATAAPFRIGAIVTDGSGSIWALGLCTATKCPHEGASRLWHQTGGRWHRPVEPRLATRPSALVSLAAVAKSVWGVGIVPAGRNSANGLIALWGPTPH